MKLLIKQRYFSWTDRYDVYDDKKNKKYQVKGDMISIGHRLHVYDSNGKEVGLVREQIVKLLPCFNIYIDGEKVGAVQKKISVLHQKYEVDYKKWDVDGDMIGWNYTVKNGRKRIAKISKEFLHWGDTYCINVEDEKDALVVLLLVIAIDAANCSQEHKKGE